jgi:hypothetical protein
MCWATSTHASIAVTNVYLTPLSHMGSSRRLSSAADSRLSTQTSSVMLRRSRRIRSSFCVPRSRSAPTPPLAREFSAAYPQGSQSGSQAVPSAATRPHGMCDQRLARRRGTGMEDPMPTTPGWNFMPPPASPCPRSRPSDAQAESGADAGRLRAHVLNHTAVPPAQEVTRPQAEVNAGKPSPSHPTRRSGPAPAQRESTTNLGSARRLCTIWPAVRDQGAQRSYQPVRGTALAQAAQWLHLPVDVRAKASTAASIRLVTCAECGIPGSIGAAGWLSGSRPVGRLPPVG